MPKNKSDKFVSTLIKEKLRISYFKLNWSKLSSVHWDITGMHKNASQKAYSYLMTVFGLEPQ